MITVHLRLGFNFRIFILLTASQNSEAKSCVSRISIEIKEALTVVKLFQRYFYDLNRSVQLR